MVKAIIQQLFRILETVIRRGRFHQHDNEFHTMTTGTGGQTSTGGICPTSFNAGHAFILAQQFIGIMCLVCLISRSCPVNRPLLLSDYLPEILIFHGITGQFCHIPIDKMTVLHPQFFSLPVHHFGKGRYTASHCLSQRHCRTVIGFQKHTVQQFIRADCFSRQYPHRR